jgi:hypothetical protein
MRLRVCLRLRIRKIKSIILNQIVKNKSFEKCVFKKLQFENTENLHFQITSKMVLF